ncbi:MAG: hypothetical protein ACM3X9_09880 [Bacillota bacterium]
MSHHRHYEENGVQTIENSDKNEHPFFKGNDLLYLSLVIPLLSEQGRQLISFLVNFGNPNPIRNFPDPLSLLKQMPSKLENNNVKDLLLTIVSLMSNPENKSGFNPSMLSSLLANMAAKKEESQ